MLSNFNLRIVMTPKMQIPFFVISIKNFTNGVRQFCGYQYLSYEILFYLVSEYSPFFQFLKSKSTQMLRPQKGNFGVSFNNTLLNFGLRVDYTLISFHTRRYK